MDAEDGRTDKNSDEAPQVRLSTPACPFQVQAAEQLLPTWFSPLPCQGPAAVGRACTWVSEPGTNPCHHTPCSTTLVCRRIPSSPSCCMVLAVKPGVSQLATREMLRLYRDRWACPWPAGAGSPSRRGTAGCPREHAARGARICPAPARDRAGAAGKSQRPSAVRPAGYPAASCKCSPAACLGCQPGLSHCVAHGPVCRGGWSPSHRQHFRLHVLCCCRLGLEGNRGASQACLG